MRIAVFSLTRERLEYTRACFSSLRDKAGCDFNHVVVDNGSEDGTQRWLIDNAGMFTRVILNERNRGIGVGSNQALEVIFGGDERPDLICKVDNDCLVKTPGVLARLAEIYSELEAPRLLPPPIYALSPRVEGIHNQPRRGRYGKLLAGGTFFEIGLTAIVGGLFRAVPARAFETYRFPENLPPAKGYDSHFCAWLKENGGQVGYVEDLVVEHYRGTTQQALDYPEYFERKSGEEIDVP